MWGEAGNKKGRETEEEECCQPCNSRWVAEQRHTSLSVHKCLGAMSHSREVSWDELAALADVKNSSLEAAALELDSRERVRGRVD